MAAAVTDSKGAFEQAQATYQTTTGANLPEDLKKSELDLKTAQEALDAEQKLYDSREALFNQGALPRKELDQAAFRWSRQKRSINWRINITQRLWQSAIRKGRNLRPDS